MCVKDISLEINKIVDEIYEKLVSSRRTLHQHPEIAFNEFFTADFICNNLDSIGIPYKNGIAKTGVVGLIKGTKQVESTDTSQKTILLRADIDALPICEETNAEYCSKISGMMHACGHDVHTACLLGAAEILIRLRNEFSGNVKIVFQPAEEAAGGAEPMINEGIMKNPNVSSAIALHVNNDIEVGNIGVKNGSIMASPDDFHLKIIGKGGHGAYPHDAIDPIVIGCQIVNAYQTIASRIINPLKPCVISVCSFNSGNCTNVIPDYAILKGTARSLEPEIREQLPLLLEDIAAKICSIYGATYEFKFIKLYPPTINDRYMTDLLRNSSKDFADIVEIENPSMGGEDFSYFGELVPSTFFNLGSGNCKRNITATIHNAKFDVDENCLKIGSAVLAKTAIDYLTETFNN